MQKRSVKKILTVSMVMNVHVYLELSGIMERMAKDRRPDSLSGFRMLESMDGRSMSEKRLFSLLSPAESAPA